MLYGDRSERIKIRKYKIVSVRENKINNTEEFLSSINCNYKCNDSRKQSSEDQTQWKGSAKYEAIRKKSPYGNALSFNGF